MSYPQPPPDGPFRQPERQPSFAPYPQNQQYGQQPYPPQPQQAAYGPPPQPAVYAHQPYPPQTRQPGRRAAGKRYVLRSAEIFWYILGCIAMGGAYFAKIPAKKAACEVFSELQLDGQGPSRGYGLQGMEGFWYVLMCVAFGAGYFAKLPVKKALLELVTKVQAAPGEYGGAIGRALAGNLAPPRPGY